MNCLRNHSPHIEGPTGCVYCYMEGLHRDADKQTAIKAELLEALKDMGHASPAMQIAGGSVEIDMAGVDAKPGTVGWLTAARVWRAMHDVNSQSCFEEAQPVQLAASDYVESLMVLVYDFARAYEHDKDGGYIVKGQKLEAEKKLREALAQPIHNQQKYRNEI